MSNDYVVLEFVLIFNDIVKTMKSLGERGQTFVHLSVLEM